LANCSCSLSLHDYRKIAENSKNGREVKKKRIVNDWLKKIKLFLAKKEKKYLQDFFPIKNASEIFPD
jgi:hypothetical protein